MADLGFDANDILRARGVDGLREHWDRNGRAYDGRRQHWRSDAGDQPSWRFDDQSPIAPPDELVVDTLPKNGLAFLGGQSGAGKTFTAIHLATCLASAQPFFGRQVRERVGSAILAFEGAGTIRQRLRAARLNAGLDELGPVAWSAESDVLTAPGVVSKLVDRLHALNAQMLKQHRVRLGIVIVDTLAAAMNLEDEQDNAEATRICRDVLRPLGEPLGALVLAVHHYGKSAATGLRGASAWRGSADNVVACIADRDETTGKVSARRLVLAKNRDGEEGPIGGFDLRFVQLAEREDGTAYGSCAVNSSDAPGAQSAPSAGTLGGTSKAARPFFDAFAEALAVHGFDHRVMGDGTSVRAVDVPRVREEFKRRYVMDEDDPVQAQDTARKAFRRFLKQLASSFGTESVNGREVMWRLQP